VTIVEPLTVKLTGVGLEDAESANSTTVTPEKPSWHWAVSVTVVPGGPEAGATLT
jgi:hypothetical protein